jgi:hypothetical protein
MANAAINYGDLNYSTGNKVILQFLSDYFVQAARNRGNPLKRFTNVSDTVASRGDVARVPVSATIASNTMTDGDQRTLDDTSVTCVDITLNTNRYAAYSMTDVARLLSGSAIDLALFKSRVAGILNDTEADFLNNFVTGSTTNVQGTYGSALTEANVCSLMVKLYNYKPPKELFEAFVSPLAWSQLVQIANFNAGSVRGYLPGEEAPALSKTWGEPDRPWHGCYWHLCQGITATTVSATLDTNNVIAHPQSVAIAFRPLDTDKEGSSGYVTHPFADEEAGVAGSIVLAKNFLNYSDEITVRLLYGYNIVKETWTGLLKT